MILQVFTHVSNNAEKFRKSGIEDLTSTVYVYIYIQHIYIYVYIYHIYIYIYIYHIYIYNLHLLAGKPFSSHLQLLFLASRQLDGVWTAIRGG